EAAEAVGDPVELPRDRRLPALRLRVHARSSPRSGRCERPLRSQARASAHRRGGFQTHPPRPPTASSAGTALPDAAPAGAGGGPRLTDRLVGGHRPSSAVLTRCRVNAGGFETRPYDAVRPPLVFEAAITGPRRPPTPHPGRARG